MSDNKKIIKKQQDKSHEVATYVQGTITLTANPIDILNNKIINSEKEVSILREKLNLSDGENINLRARIKVLEEEIEVLKNNNNLLNEKYEEALENNEELEERIKALEEDKSQQSKLIAIGQYATELEHKIIESIWKNCRKESRTLKTLINLNNNLFKYYDDNGICIQQEAWKNKILNNKNSDIKEKEFLLMTADERKEIILRWNHIQDICPSIDTIIQQLKDHRIRANVHPKQHPKTAKEVLQIINENMYSSKDDYDTILNGLENIDSICVL